MEMSGIKMEFKIKEACQKEIFFHLHECNDNFVPPLSEKVNLEEYAKKIAEFAVTFEAWAGKVLAGLVAAYLNNRENHIGYITSVSTLADFKGNGIANELLKMCFGYAREHQFTVLELEVSTNNRPAIQLYKKYGFTESARDGNFTRMKAIL